MKFAVVVLVCMAAAAHGQRASAFASVGRQPSRSNYNKPQAYKPQPFKQAPAYKPQPSLQVVAQPAAIPISAAPARQYNQGSGDAQANILKSGNDIQADGSYNYFFETDNGIAAQEQGTPQNFGGNPPVVPVVSQGSFSWTSPEGQPITITYIANENGYQPQGSAIPTSPPIPEAIARSLEYIARNAPRQ